MNKKAPGLFAFPAALLLMLLAACDQHLEYYEYIMAANPTISFSSSSITIQVGAMAEVRATLSPDTSETLTWASTDSTIAYCYNNSSYRLYTSIRGISVGSTTITATTSTSHSKGTLTVTVVP